MIFRCDLVIYIAFCSYNTFHFHCINSFTHTGRSNRDYKIWVYEHILKCLRKQIKSITSVRTENKHLSSSVANHIDEPGHKIGPKSVIVLLFKSVKGRKERFIGNLAIRKCEPFLSIEKHFVLTFNLPC